jgi:ATP-dependent DNA helicase PIF1
MELTNEQEYAYNRFMDGDNVFITGPGGCGKSYFIRKIVDDCRYNKKINVCAMTGCAAILLNCNATTLHKWAGIGLGAGTIEDNIAKISYSYFKKKVWLETEILILDEISMLSEHLFDMLDAIGKRIRHNDRPFGGIQLLFSGDFYQLPPVSKKNIEGDPESKYCFESSNWGATFKTCIVFEKIFRQLDDEYIKILNNIRGGKIKRYQNNILLGRVNVEKSGSITKIYPVRRKVEEINNKEMSLLADPEYKYWSEYLYDIKDDTMKYEIIRLKAKTSRETEDIELKYIENNLICDKEMVLKVGAYVMFVVNKTVIGRDINTGNLVEKVLCNGSCGVVKEIDLVSGYPVVAFENIEVIVNRHVWKSDKLPWLGVSHVPLILAWAITIHKSQGITLERAEIDVGSDIFENGQTYVALSRVKSLDGLYLTSFDVSKIKVSEKVIKFYEKLKGNKEKVVEAKVMDDIPVAIPMEEEY